MENKNNLPAPQNNEGADSTRALSRLIELENKRIEVERQKTEVMKKAVEASAHADENQFQFHMKRLEVNERTDNRNSDRYFYTLWGIAAIVILFIGLFTYMAFFGESNQSKIALAFLTHLASAIAGYGIINWIANLIKKSQE